VGDGEWESRAEKRKATALTMFPNNPQLNETELEVSSDSASYKQRLEVLQQQEELIEDEEEQEMKESEARRLKKEAEEEAKAELEEAERIKEEKETADTLLPDSEAAEATEEVPKETAPEDVRMTSEQLTELGQALEILSAKSSVMKERTELRQLMDEQKMQEVEGEKPNPLAKRIKGILTKIDKQLEEYDNEVGSKLHMFETDHEGKISTSDLKSALEVIAHRPTDEAIAILLEKLDVDHDNFVPLAEIVALAEGEGLGILLDETEAAAEIQQTANVIRDDRASGLSKSTGKEMEKKEKKEKDKPKLKKEDIVSDP
ncbi:hypothetical protein P7C70_g7457, partial [Phenoliferia sp. Uapishka_3]